MHLLRVPRILIEEMGIQDTESLVIGILHDVLEDTSYPKEKLLQTFGTFVVHGVELLSRPREKDWATYVAEVVAKGDTSIIAVKIADKLDNARSHAFSTNVTLREKDYYKTVQVMKPIINMYAASLWPRFEEVLNRW